MSGGGAGFSSQLKTRAAIIIVTLVVNYCLKGLKVFRIGFGWVYTASYEPPL